MVCDSQKAAVSDCFSNVQIIQQRQEKKNSFPFSLLSIGSHLQKTQCYTTQPIFDSMKCPRVPDSKSEPLLLSIRLRQTDKLQKQRNY